MDCTICNTNERCVMDGSDTARSREESPPVAESRPVYHVRLRDFPSDDRPRERLLRLGEASLRDAELLAIILRTGAPELNAVQLSERLLRDFGGLVGLMRVDVAELAVAHGVGPAKATAIRAALEIGRRMLLADPAPPRQIRSSDDAARLFMLSLGDLVVEELHVVCLDAQHGVQRTALVARGDGESITVNVAEALRWPAWLRSSAALLVHNHPSGFHELVSDEDEELTRLAVRGARLLGFTLLDHLIVSRTGFLSLRALWPDMFGDSRVMTEHQPLVNPDIVP